MFLLRSPTSILNTPPKLGVSGDSGLKKTEVPEVGSVELQVLPTTLRSVVKV